MYTGSSEPTPQRERVPTPQQIFDDCTPLIAHIKGEEPEWANTPLDPVNNPDTYLRFTNEHDPRFRKLGGAAVMLTRQQLDKNAEPSVEPPKISEAREEEIMQLASVWEMDRHETPMPRTPSKVNIVLGAFGGNTAARGLWAAEQLMGQGAHDAHLIFAASRRPLSQTELDATGLPAGSTESDACYAAANEINRRYPQLQVFIETTLNPKADTAAVLATALDSYQEVAHASIGETYTIITNPIYVAYTEQEGMRAAEQRGISTVHVAGAPTSHEVMQRRTVLTYMTEITRTMRAALLRQQAQLQRNG